MRWFKKHFIITTLMVIAILLAMTVALSSQIAVLILRNYLSDYASDVAIERLTISWWRSELTLEGFSANNQNGDTIAVDDLYIDWNMGELWNNHLLVNDVSLSGVSVDIISNEFKPLQIGPIPIPKTPANAEPQEAAEPWSVHIAKINLQDIATCIKDDAYTTSDFAIPLNTQNSINHCVNLSSLSIADPLTIDKSQQISLNTDIQLSELVITERDADVLVSLGDVSIEPVSYNDDNLDINDLNIEDIRLLSTADSDISDYGLAVDGISVKELTLDLTTNSVLLNEGEINVLSVLHRASDSRLHELASFAALSLAEFSLMDEAISLNSLDLEQLKLLEQLVEAESSHIVSLNQLTVSEFQQAGHKLNIGDVGMANLETSLIMSEQGVNAALWLPASEEAQVETEIEEEAPQTQIKLASFNLGDQSRLTLLDQNLAKPITHQIEDISVSIGRLAINDTQTDEQETNDSTPIEYSMNYGPVGTIGGAGELVVKDTLNSLNLSGDIKRLDLVNVSDYASRYIGYRIDSGLLDVSYKVALTGKELDVDLKTLLEKFELGNLQEHEKSEMNEELGLPLPLALNLLRDSDNNIELDLPIKGSTDDPEFSAASIVSTVMVKAIKNAVIYNYSPLGMLSLASGVLDLATALRFDPVAFQPTGLDIDAKGREQLDKVAQLMSEKPRITMLICGVATQADLPVQQTDQPTTIQTDGASKPTPGPTTAEALTTEVVDSLISTAKSRQDVVINYLVNEGGVARDRLLGCNIKLATKADAKPVVTLSI